MLYRLQALTDIIPLVGASTTVLLPVERLDGLRIAHKISRFKKGDGGSKLILLTRVRVAE